MAEQRIVKLLERLVETCRDGQQGYLEAAEHISDSDLRSFFNNESLERARYASELEGELQRLGEPAGNETGSIAGAVHRGWLDLSAAISGDEGVLSAIESGEDTAKKLYEEALREPLPEVVEGTVRSQAQAVIAAHDHVKLLRDRRRAA
ncbi:MAG TPA: PA2169 family four-helix-bundle protein [Terriglobales bacterium]|nr:PA2169 family four-helix-bundle protein [Terriglobales bacterium]